MNKVITVHSRDANEDTKNVKDLICKIYTQIFAYYKYKKNHKRQNRQ